ncbi:cytochrome P450 714D1-like [Eucalyptus grandis]|uniref:cytochrome P450 714D1-like n=1 Tax=Eucalyptus grandis TaxID=71139 RepID=UPI00192EF1B0|nr:cytochrome P450 714D1-like [Eucalyptus grandis]
MAGVRAHQEENRSSLKPEKDLLQMILESQETTATTISWSLMPFALHPERQDRIRAEIVEFCGDRLCHGGSLDFENASEAQSCKCCMIWLLGLIAGLLTVVTQETLCLYCPAIVLVYNRRAQRHRERAQAGEVQGRGVRGLQASSGVRAIRVREQAVLVRTFVMLEMKIVLTFILSRFSFSLSPKYRPSPVYRMVLVPEYGMRLVLRKI